MLASGRNGGYSSVMPGEPEGKHAQTRFEPAWSEIKARQMGDLTRGSSRWDVLLETARDSTVGAVRGRIHFISGNIHRLSGWIFLEWSEKDVEARFSAFAQGSWELWNLLKSLGGD